MAPENKPNTSTPPKPDDPKWGLELIGSGNEGGGRPALPKPDDNNQKVKRDKGDNL